LTSQALLLRRDTLEPVKLLAFDLDGTIVTSDYRLPNRILNAIGAARQAGHLVTVVTGRVHASAKPYLEQLQLELPVGTAQGGCVTDVGGAVLRDLRVPEATVRAVIAQFNAELFEFFVPLGDCVYVKNPDSKRDGGEPYWDWIRNEGRPVLPFAEFPNVDPSKITMHKPNLGDLTARAMRAFPDQMFYPWSDQFLEITHKGAHKGAALELIADMAGVPQADVIAFGDGNNDLKMLEWAGYSVAVGHFEAHDSGLTNETIAIPDENGVADWLETFLSAGGRTPLELEIAA
jgi:5-amino-6-(5-phospho-D-ribitylamino)uracil phosphatase